MPETFLCTRTGQACPTAELCTIANQPLVGAVTRITKESTGKGKFPTFASMRLVRELASTGGTMMADFAPTADTKDATICPSDLLKRAPSGVKPAQVAKGIGVIAGQCVDAVILSIKADDAVRHRRRSV